MKIFLKVIIIVIAIGIGLYLGGASAGYLLDHKYVYLGKPAGNLLIPAFYLLLCIVVAGLFGVLTGLFFIIRGRRKSKAPYK
jgi:hypothetical protein